MLVRHQGSFALLVRMSSQYAAQKEPASIKIETSNIPRVIFISAICPRKQPIPRLRGCHNQTDPLPDFPFPAALQPVDGETNPRTPRGAVNIGLSMVMVVAHWFGLSEPRHGSAAAAGG